MKTTKIVIKNLFGIKETELDGRSVEISGPKGSGKTSVLDSIRYALTNRSDRDYIVHRGADEGEILIETDTGLSIDLLIIVGIFIAAFVIYTVIFYSIKGWQWDNLFPYLLGTGGIIEAFTGLLTLVEIIVGRKRKEKNNDI